MQNTGKQIKQGTQVKRRIPAVLALAIVAIAAALALAGVQIAKAANADPNVTITKYGYDGSPDNVTVENLAGATLQVKKAGNVVKTFTTTDSPAEITLDPGTYTLVETQAPEGYELAGSVEFTVPEVVSYVTTSPAPALTSVSGVYVPSQSLPFDGPYKIKGQVVFCIDTTIVIPPTGTYTSSQLTQGAGPLSRDELLRILYVGYYGDAKGYYSQFRAAEDYTKEEQFWIATQYAITSYTNPGDAEEYFGKYLGPNKSLAKQMIRDAKDSSIAIPEGTNAYIYRPSSRNSQITVAASFPKVEKLTVGGPVEIKLGDQKTNTPSSGSEDGKVIINKTDDQGNVLKGAKFKIVNANGKVVKEFTSQGNDEFALPVGTYTLIETQAPAGYQIQGDGKYSFTIEPATVSAVSSGQTASVVGAPTVGTIIRGTGSMEIVGGSALAFCVNPQATFLWETGSTYSYSVLSESQVDLNAFGTKNPAGARGWVNAAPSNIGLTSAKMEQVKKVLWATYDFAMTGNASKDHTGIIQQELGQASFLQAGVYQATQAAIAEIVSPGSVNWNKLGNNHTTGNVKALALALVAAAQGQSGYFAAYGGYSIVYLQSSDPSTQNLVVPGSETPVVTVVNNKTPEISTTATDQADGDKNVVAEPEAKVVDVVRYENLIPGKTYTMAGELHKKSDGSVIEGTQVYKTFTAAKGGTGKVELEFTFNASELAGEKLVAFETCTYNGEVVATHTDINDEDQTVDITEPEIATTATDDSDGDKELANTGIVTVKDVVTYTNLTPGKTYTMKGELHKKSDGYAIEDIQVYKTFNADQSGSGTVELTFTVDASQLSGEKLVVFETCTYNGEVVATHADINDGAQTVEVPEQPEEPEIATTAKDAADDDKQVAPSTQAKVIDVVEYKNLIPNKIYTMSGELVKKSDQTVIATASKEFKADASGSGTVELEFTFDASKLAGQSAVAFETCKDGDDVVATHKDINDEDQTVEIEKPSVEISKIDAATSEELPGARLIVTKRGSEEIVAQHTSTTEPWRITLEPGEYTLTELTAPQGYLVAESIDFTVDENGLVGSDRVVMADAPEEVPEEPEEFEVYVDKTDLGGVEVPGAVISVTDENGLTSVWRSTTEPHRLTLEPGLYVMREEYAPKGYQQITTVIDFSVDENGIVQVLNTVVEGGALEVTADGTIILKDAPLPENPEVVISKTDAATSAELPGAKLIITNDANEIVESWTSTTTPHKVKLAPGNYILTEITAPEGYEVAESIVFTVDENGLVGSDKVEMQDAPIPPDVPVVETVSYTVSKVWNDSDNVDGVRPSSIDVILVADGVEAGRATLHASTGWTHTWTDLVRFNAAGAEIVYSVVEDGVPAGYVSSVNGNVITNTHTPEMTSVSGTKVWNDADNQDGMRPDSIFIELLANGQPVASKTVSAADGWAYSFTNLPKYSNGSAITYTIREANVAGYSRNYYGFDITNTYTPGSTNVSVTKAWDDANNKDGLRPASIVVALSANGSIIDTQVLSDANNWFYTWNGLDEMAGGQYIAYSVDELAVPAGYSMSMTGVDNTFVITNTHIPEEPREALVDISKTDAATSAELPGAELIIRDAFGRVVESWISTTIPHRATLKPGAYTLTEIQAPLGYVLSEEVIGFVVDEGGVVGGPVEMKNSRVPEQPKNPEVVISKIDAATTAELPGAKLIIAKKATGEVVASHTSTTEPWKITLEPGEYTLTELTAPKGYLVAESIDFVVDENGLVGSDKVEMVDAPEEEPEIPEEPKKPEVVISKTDATTSEELPGAELIITLKATGEVVGRHLSTTKPWKVPLEPGEYTLTERTAPKGYEIAESIDFTVDENGLVGSDKVEMKDAPTPETPTVLISKTDAATSKELPGATLIIKNAAGEIVEHWTSTNEPQLVSLKPGTYTLTEITAPEGYEVAETITFSVNSKGLVGSDKVEMKDKPISFEEPTPSITTNAGGTVINDTDQVITDIVYYNGLKAGETYTVTGDLHIKNADGTDGGVLKSVSEPVSFKAAEGGSGTVRVTFTFDASELTDKNSVVVFERLYLGTETTGKPVATHEDITSVEQTVAVSLQPEEEPEPERPNTSVTAASLDVVANKTLDGKPATTAGQFSFQLKGISENAKDMLFTTTNDAQGKLVFKDLSFTQAGSYIFELSEVVPANTKGITYDSSIYNVHVRVTREGNKLVAEYWVVDSKGTELASECSFKNTTEKEEPENPTNPEKPRTTTPTNPTTTRTTTTSSVPSSSVGSNRVSSSTSSAPRTSTAKTGDSTSVALMGGFLAAGLIAVLASRKLREH